MFQLNQRHTDTAQRTFKYELPAFLAKEGPCFVTIKAKPYSECERAMKLVNEKLMINVKVQGKVLADRLESKLAGAKDAFDMSDPVVAEAREVYAEGDALAQNEFHRDMAIGIVKNCVGSWETNIYDNESKAAVKPDQDNLMALAAIAFPEGIISDTPDLATMFHKMREDILNAGEQQAADEVRRDDEKN